jgi:hypothetical protein
VFAGATLPAGSGLESGLEETLAYLFKKRPEEASGGFLGLLRCETNTFYQPPLELMV